MFLLPLFCGFPERGMNQTKAYSDYHRVVNDDKSVKSDQINDGIVTEDDNVNMQLVVREDERESSDADGQRWFWTYFPHDLFLLENQLPFFVLKKIHNLAYHSSESQLICIMKHAFSKLLSDYTKLDSNMVIAPVEEVHHLLHLCHLYFRPILQQKSTVSELPEFSQMFRLGSATQLYEEGVRFEARSESTTHSLLDITFSSLGKLVMPCLYVDEKINSLLRNLIAPE